MHRVLLTESNPETPDKTAEDGDDLRVGLAEFVRFAIRASVLPRVRTRAGKR